MNGRSPTPLLLAAILVSLLVFIFTTAAPTTAQSPTETTPERGNQPVNRFTTTNGDPSLKGPRGECFTNCAEVHVTQSNCTADAACVWDNISGKCHTRCENIGEKFVCVESIGGGTTADNLDTTSCYWDEATESCYTDCTKVVATECKRYSHCAVSTSGLCHFRCVDRVQPVNTSDNKVPDFGFLLTFPRGKINATLCDTLYNGGHCFYDGEKCAPLCDRMHNFDRGALRETCDGDDVHMCFSLETKCKDHCGRLKTADACAKVGAAAKCRWSFTMRKCYDSSSNLFDTDFPEVEWCQRRFPDQVQFWPPTGRCVESCAHAGSNRTECTTTPQLMPYCSFEGNACVLDCGQYLEGDCTPSKTKQRCAWSAGKCRRQCEALTDMKECAWLEHCRVYKSATTGGADFCSTACGFKIPVVQGSDAGTTVERCAVASTTCELLGTVCVDKCSALSFDSCVRDDGCAWIGSKNGGCARSCTNSEKTDCFNQIGAHCEAQTGAALTGATTMCLEKCADIDVRTDCTRFAHCEWVENVGTASASSTTKNKCQKRCAWYQSKTACQTAKDYCEWSGTLSVCMTLCATLDAASCADRETYPQCTNLTAPSPACSNNCRFRYAVDDSSTCLADESNCEFYDAVGCTDKCSRFLAAGQSACEAALCVWTGQACISDCALKYSTSANCDVSDKGRCQVRQDGAKCQNVCGDFKTEALCKRHANTSADACWWHPLRGTCMPRCRDRFSTNASCAEQPDCFWTPRGCEQLCTQFESSEQQRPGANYAARKDDPAAALCNTFELASHCNWTTKELGNESLTTLTAAQQAELLARSYTCVPRCAYYPDKWTCGNTGLGCNWLEDAAACVEPCGRAGSMRDCQVWWPRCEWKIESAVCVPNCRFGNKTEADCGVTPECEWAGSVFKCRQRCASLSQQQCDSDDYKDHCKYEDGMCKPEDCTKRTRQDGCEYGGENRCIWIANQCYNKCSITTGSGTCSAAGTHCDYYGSPWNYCAIKCSWYESKTGKCPTDGTCEDTKWPPGNKGCNRACGTWGSSNSGADCPNGYCWFDATSKGLDNNRCRSKQCFDESSISQCHPNKTSICADSNGPRKCIEDCSLFSLKKSICDDYADCMWDYTAGKCIQNCVNRNTAVPTTAYEKVCNLDHRCEWLPGHDKCIPNCKWLEHETGSCSGSCTRTTLWGVCSASCSTLHGTDSTKCRADGDGCFFSKSANRCAQRCENQTQESCSGTYCEIRRGKCVTKCSNFDGDDAWCSEWAHCLPRMSKCVNNCDYISSNESDICKSINDALGCEYNGVTRKCWMTQMGCTYYSGSNCQKNPNCFYSSVQNECYRKASYWSAEPHGCSSDSNELYVWRDGQCVDRCWITHSASVGTACNDDSNCIALSGNCTNRCSKLSNDTCVNYAGNFCRLFQWGCDQNCPKMDGVKADCDKFSHCQWNATRNECRVKCKHIVALDECNEAEHCTALGMWNAHGDGSQCVPACDQAADLVKCGEAPYGKYCQSNGTWCVHKCGSIQEASACGIAAGCTWRVGNLVNKDGSGDSTTAAGHNAAYGSGFGEGRCTYDCFSQTTQSNCEATSFCKWRALGGSNGNKCLPACERFVDVAECVHAHNQNVCVWAVGGLCRTKCDLRYSGDLFKCQEDATCEMANYSSTNVKCADRCSTVNMTSCNGGNTSCTWSTTQRRCVRGCSSYVATPASYCPTTTDCRIALKAAADRCRPKCALMNSSSSCAAADCYWTGLRCLEDCGKQYATQTACEADTTCFWSAASSPKCANQCGYNADAQWCEQSDACVFRAGTCRKSCRHLFPTGAGNSVECRLHAECDVVADNGLCMDACHVFNTKDRCTKRGGTACVWATWTNNTCIKQCASRYSKIACAGDGNCDWLGSKGCAIRCANITDKEACTANSCEWVDRSDVRVVGRDGKLIQQPKPFCRRLCSYVQSAGSDECFGEGHCRYTASNKCVAACSDFPTRDFCIGGAGQGACMWLANERKCVDRCSVWSGSTSKKAKCERAPYSTCVWNAGDTACYNNCSALTDFFGCEQDSGDTRCSWDFANRICRDDCNTRHRRNATTCVNDTYCEWSTKEDKCRKKCTNTNEYSLCSAGTQANCVWLGKLPENKFEVQFYAYDYVLVEQQADLFYELAMDSSSSNLGVHGNITRIAVENSNLTQVVVKVDGVYDAKMKANETTNRDSERLRRHARAKGMLELLPTPQYRTAAGAVDASAAALALLLSAVLVAALSLLPADSL